MSDAIQSALAHEDYQKVMKDVSEMSDDQLIQQRQKLTDEQIVNLAMYILHNCRSAGIQKVLMYGAMLHLFFMATDTDRCRELFQNLYEDLGLNRTKAYAYMACWRTFGAKLIAEPALRKGFVAGSLIVLSEQKTPELARAEALDLARQGERISIKQAQALQRKHRMQLPKGAEPVAQRRRQGWLFDGDVARIRVTLKTADNSDVERVIADLETAIEELRQQDDMQFRDHAAA